MSIFLPYISDLTNRNIRLELTKLSARLFHQTQFRLAFKNTFSTHFFSIVKTMFLVAG